MATSDPDDQRAAASDPAATADTIAPSLADAATIAPALDLASAETIAPARDAANADTLAPGPIIRARTAPIAETLAAGAPTLDGVSARASSATLPRGTVIGRYVVVDALGAGGMGVVYVAFDPKLNRKVALKLVKGQHDVAVGPTRIEREAQALARLSHPNVVTIYDVGAFDDQIFLAMELVEGQTLSTWQATARPWREILAAYLEAARGLAAAHAAGVIHRDFKPGNVIVGDDGRVRVLDFGLARGTDQAEPEAATATVAPAPTSDETTLNDALSAELTQLGSVMGTPLYMPPEQFRGEVVTEAADQFSFCVALYEALYGMLPFRSQFGQPLPPVAPAPEDTRVPAWLRRHLLVGLSARAEDRFPSMAALIAALEDDPAIRRRKWLLAGGGVVAAAAIAVGAFQLRGATVAATTDPCAVGAPLAGIWDDTTRPRLQSALAASGEPDAQGTFVRTATALDAVSQQWLAARQQTCALTRRDRTQSEAALLARLDCFDRQKADLAALVALLLRADAAIAKQSTSAVRQLAGPALCDNPQLYIAPPPVEIAERVAQIRTRMSEAYALVLAGKDAEADTRLAGIVDDARTLGYPPLLAEALYVRGRRRLSDFKGTLASLDEAEVLAIESRADALAARAAATRLHKAAVAGHADDRVDEWSARAKAWVQRDHDVEAIFALEQGLSTLATNRGDHVTAERHTRRALEVGTRAFGVSNPRVFGITNDLAYDLIQLGRHDEAIAMLGSAIAAFDKAYGERTLRVRTALDIYGYALNAVGRTAEARKAIERALAITDAADIIRAFLLCDLARVDLAEDKAADAVRNAEAGMRLLRELGVAQQNIAGNQDALAFAYAAVGRHAEALAESRACLAEFAKAKNESAETVRCLLAEGAALVELGQPTVALEVLGRALQRLAGHPAEPGLVATVQFELARAIIASDGDRTSARELASQARLGLGRLPHKRALRERVETWSKQQGF